MASKTETKKSTMSWADEAEDDVPVVKATPAWAKTHDWGVPKAAPATSGAGYDKNFPAPNAKDDFPPPGTSKPASKPPMRDQPRKDADDVRGPAPSTQNQREERPAREYPPRDREDRPRDYPTRDNQERNFREERPPREDRPRDFPRNDRRGGEDFDFRNNDGKRGETSESRSELPPRTHYSRNTEGREDRGEFRARDSRDRGEGRGGFERNFDRNDRGDRGDRGDFGGRRDNRGYNREREPREVPFPESAPFTAYVSNLSYDTSNTDLQHFFEEEHKFKVLSVRLPPPSAPDTLGRLNKGFGYVEFEDLETLKSAVAINGTPFSERSLKIAVATPEVKRSTEDRERPKLNLAPRTSAPSESEDKEDSESKAKSNPFGAAKPRDETAILRKKEEERKEREKDKEGDSQGNETEEAQSEETEVKPRRSDQKLFQPSRGRGGRDDRGPREPREDRGPREDRPPREPREDRGPREDRPPREDRGNGERRGGFGGSFRGRGSDRGRRDSAGGERRDNTSFNRGERSDRGRGGKDLGGERPKRENTQPEKSEKSFQAKHSNLFDALGEDQE